MGRMWTRSRLSGVSGVAQQMQDRGTMLDPLAERAGREAPRKADARLPRSLHRTSWCQKALTALHVAAVRT